jgi:hypothetical protein
MLTPPSTRPQLGCRSWLASQLSVCINLCLTVADAPCSASFQMNQQQSDRPAAPAAAAAACSSQQPAAQHTAAGSAADAPAAAQVPPLLCPARVPAWIPYRECLPHKCGRCCWLLMLLHTTAHDS